MHYHSSYFLTHAFTIGLIEREFNKHTIPYNEWRQSPFYVNKLESRHGNLFVFKHKTKEMYFMTSKVGDVVLIKTVTPRFDHRVKMRYTS